MKYSFKIMEKNKGFTLIELLVVIAIIGLIASIIISNLSLARAKGQVTGKAQAVMEIQKAIELYRSTNGYYPGESSANEGYYHLHGTSGTPSFTSDTNLSTLLSSYIKFSNPNISSSADSFYYFDRQYLNTATQYSCGETSRPSGGYPYMIYFSIPSSPSIPLKLPKVYNNGTLVGNVYCLTVK